MSQLPPMQSGPPPGNPYAAPSFGGGPSGPPPDIKTYLVEAILVTLCCNWLFGIPAIVYAAQVKSKLSSGDINGAMQASANAKKWCIIALCVGIVCNLIVGGLQIVAAVSQQQGG